DQSGGEHAQYENKDDCFQMTGDTLRPFVWMLGPDVRRRQNQSLGEKSATISNSTDEQNRPLLFGDPTFTLQADGKRFYMFRFVHRLEANLRNPILIYPHHTCANWIFVLGIDRPQLIILARLRRRKIADTNHAALAARLPCDRRFRVGWSRRRGRQCIKRRLHQRIDCAYISELVLQPHAIDGKQAAKHCQRRSYCPRHPTKRSASRRYWNDPFSFHGYLTHNALLQRYRRQQRWSG